MTKPEFKPYDNEERLRKLYVGASMSQKQIADLFGVAQTTISSALQRHGISTKSGNETNAARYYTHKSQGYENWKVYNGGDSRSVSVHQLVAIANGADPWKVFGNAQWHIHHKNGIEWDNRPENLELLSVEEHHRLHRERGDWEPYQHYTEEELLEWIDSFVQEFGVVPVSADIKNWPGPTLITYRDRFGSFTDAIKEAGYKPRREA